MLPEYTSVFLHDEIPTLGCGKRRVAILRHTREKTLLFEPSSLRVAEVDSEVFKSCKPETLEPERDFKPAYLAARLLLAKELVFQPAGISFPEMPNVP